MASQTTIRPVLVIAGIGNASGTGGATARLFSQALGYRVALIARNAQNLEAAATDIRSAGGDAAAFPVSEYSWTDISQAFGSIKTHFSGSPIRAAVFNVGHRHRGPFLELKEQDLQESLQVNVVAAAAFAQEAIRAFLEAPEPTAEEQSPSQGTLLFTGATASLRGGELFGAFAAGKFALRALSQSLAREFGKKNIHVGHCIIDGNIVNDRSKELFKSLPGGGAHLDDESKRLSPESIAKSYLYLHSQDRSAWTQELDLRPAHEKF